jgi:hypothetical protein
MARQHGAWAGGRKTVRGTGFARAADAAAPLVQAGGAARGFAEHRIITLWAEIAGADLAPLCRPMKLSHRGREGGLGGTLTLLVEGAAAPEVSHQADVILDRINRVCGHRAVARLKLVQTHGLAAALAEPPAPWGPAPATEPPCSPAIESIADEGLRTALARLERNIRRRVAGQPSSRGHFR